jgi:hypothetical protein
VREFNFKIWVKSKNLKIVLYKEVTEKIAPLRPKAPKNFKKPKENNKIG